MTIVINGDGDGCSGGDCADGGVVLVSNCDVGSDCGDADDVVVMTVLML